MSVKKRMISDNNRKYVRFGWLIPICVAVAVYCVAFNNYFSFDDFIWLNRGRSLMQDWSQMFRPDVTYFDPLIHLMFFVEYNVVGINPSWYHGVDIVIHATNSLLVYYFARLLTGDEKAAIYVGVIFAGSFAVADAVVWSSSRVDLIATFFSICSMIQFVIYLRSNKNKHIIFSFLLFVLALGAKGTPLILPMILFWLTFLEKNTYRNIIHLAPFGIVIISYVVLLKLNMHQASLPLDRLHFNVHNITLAFCSLFIPEPTLKFLDLTTTTSVLFVVVFAISVLTKSNDKLCKTGLFIIIAALLPVLVVTDFNLVTEYSSPSKFLSSPSHRIYLASVGAALLCGGFLRSIETLIRNALPRLSTVIVFVILAGIVIGNVVVVRDRNQLWEIIGSRSRAAVKGLLPYRKIIAEGDQIGLIYFPGSGGFMLPMVKVALDLNDISIINKITLGMIENSEILQKAEKTYLFVLDKDGRVQDKSQLYRQQLVYNRMAIEDPSRVDYRNECQKIASILDRQID